MEDIFGASGEGDVAPVGHLNASGMATWRVGVTEACELSLRPTGMSREDLMRVLMVRDAT